MYGQDFPLENSEPGFSYARRDRLRYNLWEAMADPTLRPMANSMGLSKAELIHSALAKGDDLTPPAIVR